MKALIAFSHLIDTEARTLGSASFRVAHSALPINDNESSPGEVKPHHDPHRGQLHVLCNMISLQQVRIGKLRLLIKPHYLGFVGL